jgi:hypothetical protein
MVPGLTRGSDLTHTIIGLAMRTGASVGAAASKPADTKFHRMHTKFHGEKKGLRFARTHPRKALSMPTITTAKRQ